jgi:hypothetical protein
MNRLNTGLVFSLSLCSFAHAGDLLPMPQTRVPQTNGRCAVLGEGFFPVSGSDACVKISGHISAGVGFDSPASSGQNFGAAATGFNTELGATGDLRFNTPAGPGRVYVDVRRDTNPRWAVDSQ